MCNNLTDIYAFDNSTDKITTHSPMIQYQYGPIDLEDFSPCFKKKTIIRNGRTAVMLGPDRHDVFGRIAKRF